MDKKKALEILIDHSFVIPEEAKQGLKAKVKKMNAQQIQDLGVFLAREKQTAITSNEGTIKNIENAINQLERKKI